MFPYLQTGMDNQFVYLLIHLFGIICKVIFERGSDKRALWVF